MSDSSKPHALVSVARNAILSHLSGSPLPHGEMSEDPGEPAGTFVSLKKAGQLRGCIGTIRPVRSTLTQEIMDNAVSAATRDPRFKPVVLEELDEISISVDVLGTPEPVSGLEELDPSRFGVIVKSGHRKGLLLPDLPGVTTSEEQVRIARQKAGIGAEEPVELLRFEVKRYV
ncbi:MAG: AmmeMemoRadiSam system protein A [bacterium]|nr:AmmeMemoRadiSam system protein A [bacterium]MDT8366293.1 AmmeMemoRadiSam system protein A [bacterium]